MKKLMSLHWSTCVPHLAKWQQECDLLYQDEGVQRVLPLLVVDPFKIPVYHTGSVAAS